MCAPDASFVLCYKGQRRGYFLEMDRATSGIHQIACSKTPGFAALAENKMHGRHFPGAESVPFRVLMVTQSEGRRDALAKAIAGKPGAHLWRFLALTKINQILPVNSGGGFQNARVHPEILSATAEQLLLDWDVLGCDGAVRTLIKRTEVVK